MLQQIIKLYIKFNILPKLPPELRKAYNHYSKICKKHNIHITYLPYNQKYRAQVALRKIFIPLPTNLHNITITYHEIGHIMHRFGSIHAYHGHIIKTEEAHTKILLKQIFGDPNKIRYECNASLWAVRNAPIKLNYFTLKNAILSYTEYKELLVQTPHKLLKKLEDQMHSRCKL